MTSDVQPSEIDWVFCWRTSTGDVRDGSRDTSMNGVPVRYRPNAVSHDSGLRTIVRGREGNCPQQPTGPRLDEQGGISRMSIFAWGHVVRPLLVPARTERELGVLRKAARASVFSGEASEWAIAAFQARKRVRWAVHIAAARSVVLGVAARLEAPWTIEVREKLVGSWTKGSQIFCFDREGRVTETLEADTVFDDAALPKALSARNRETKRPRGRL